MRYGTVIFDAAEVICKRRFDLTVRVSLYALCSVLLGGLFSSAQATPGAQLIYEPNQARQLGLESLRVAVQKDGGVPLPDNLGDFVKDRVAAVQLGKALFWDMQVGSDGVQACASCHFHAGADNRATNALNPNQQTILDQRSDDVVGYLTAGFTGDNEHFEIKGVNARLTPDDFPFVKSIGAIERTADGKVRPGTNNSNDIAASMGVFANTFDGINLGSAVDFGTTLLDPVFNLEAKQSVRRVEPRNTPTTINAVFNFTNFWDGHANPHFNGRTAFGDQDPSATILINRAGVGLTEERLPTITKASLASQAMAPPLSAVEMSFGDSAQQNGRRLREIGIKLLRAAPQTGQPITPLGLQKVDRSDSVLGSLAKVHGAGLSTTYEALIKRAFHDQYWNSTETKVLPSTPNNTSFTQMEANFGLFFGMSVALYEATLVSDQTPFDQWMETGYLNRGFGDRELAGLNLFVGAGQCVQCHAGPEFTKASVRSAQLGDKAISAMAVADGTALYDRGFYNISVTPTTDDIGRGDVDPFSQPLAFSRQALFERLGIQPVSFPIIGNATIPAKEEDGDGAVCNDSNTNGVCEPTETMLPAFQRVAVDGAFKTPGLRNSELTGPYFHNGGMATLRQVVQFYNRGGNFCQFNKRDLDPRIRPLDLSTEQEEQLVAFLTALTDARVKYQRAPFDHPELRIPRDGLDTVGRRRIKAVGAYGSKHGLATFLRLDPKTSIYTPKGICVKD